MKSRPLGFDKEQVMYLPIRDPQFANHWDVFRHQVESLPYVQAVGLASRLPSAGGGQSGLLPEGADESRMTNIMNADASIADVLGLEILQGRYFSEEFGADMMMDNDTLGVAVVNETAVDQFGWEDPLGKTMRVWGVQLTVIGVVRDFHFNSLHQPIEPLVIANYGGQDFYGRNLVAIRIAPERHEQAVDDIEAIWSEVAPDRPFLYRFLDERFDMFYRSNQEEGKLLQSFAVIAIFIACLGLTGLAAYSTQRRIREIAVRKVMGATVPQVLRLITREFLLLVLLANLIAWPVAFFAMRSWLEGFAYRVAVPWMLYPGAAVLALLIAVISIATIAYRAAETNPADALRHE